MENNDKTINNSELTSIESINVEIATTANAISQLNITSDETIEPVSDESPQTKNDDELKTEDKQSSTESEIQQESIEESTRESNEEVKESSINQDESTNKKESKKRKDPAAIPRKGYFFEHDNREGDAQEAANTKALKEKVNSDRNQTSKLTTTKEVSFVCVLLLPISVAIFLFDACGVD